MPVFMQSRRLSYWVPGPDQALILARWVNDPEIRRNLDHRVFPVGVEAEKAWIAGLEARTQAKTDVSLVFGLRGDTSPMGVVSLHHVHWIARTAEIGILVAKDHWGQGYGSEATDRVVQYAFYDLGLNSVRLRANADHVRALNAYEKVGFVREGILRQAVFRDGSFVDVVMMSVLKDEWTPRDSFKTG